MTPFSKIVVLTETAWPSPGLVSGELFSANEIQNQAIYLTEASLIFFSTVTLAMATNLLQFGLASQAQLTADTVAVDRVIFQATHNPYHLCGSASSSYQSLDGIRLPLVKNSALRWFINHAGASVANFKARFILTVIGHFHDPPASEQRESFAPTSLLTAWPPV